MVVSNHWVFRSPHPELEARLAQSIGCTPLLAALLVNRGIRSSSDARRFLHPKLLDLADPFDLPDMEKGVERIVAGMQRGETIGIFGDYDVDGISSVCLLLDFFRLVEYPVRVRLPHRIEEGYGLRKDTVEELAREGVRLLVTVDNGSSAVEEIALARTLGMDVVVTDHHQPGAALPDAAALVNPWIGDRGLATELAGVGVTFKFVWALSQRFTRSRKLSPEFRQFLMDSLALVALGTIADVVPLVGENRILARHGLTALESSQRAGLRALARSARPAGGRLSARDVGFRIAPRLNAAGRLGCAGLALRLLRSEDETEAATLAEALERENTKRQEIQRKIREEARERVRREVDLERERVIVLDDGGWHPGVIGIVAGQLVEEFRRPAILLAVDGDRCRGSARSVPQVHICDALARCGELLDGYGGHELAAGLECRRENLSELREALDRSISLEPEQIVHEVGAEREVSLSQVSSRFLTEVDRLAPFGEGNPEPVLAALDLEVVGQPRVLGSAGRHVAFHVRKGSPALRAVAFGRGDLCPLLGRRGARVSLLFQPRWNEWQGRREIELKVEDLQVSPP